MLYGRTTLNRAIILIRPAKTPGPQGLYLMGLHGKTNRSHFMRDSSSLTDSSFVNLSKVPKTNVFESAQTGKFRVAGYGVCESVAAGFLRASGYATIPVL